MQAQDTIDFSKIDWEIVDKEKAEFIYQEALEHHRGIIENNNKINDKALGLLSFTMPIMAALAGYFAISWGKETGPLFTTAITACIFLFVIMILLLLIVAPRGIFEGAGSPGAYFTADYYKRDMKGLYVGNIVDLQKSILHDRKILNIRGWFFRIAIILCAAFPVVSFLVFLLCRRK